jgi:peptidoglycan hydrolase CwlO-like protein
MGFIASSIHWLVHLQVTQKHVAEYHAQVDTMKSEHEQFMANLQQENSNLQAKLNMVLAQLEGAQERLSQVASDNGVMTSERNTLKAMLDETRQTARVSAVAPPLCLKLN